MRICNALALVPQICILDQVIWTDRRCTGSCSAGQELRQRVEVALMV